VFDDALIVLFVNSCEPVNVATVLSILNVTSFEPTTEVIPVPPVSLKLSPNETASVVDVSSIKVIVGNVFPLPVKSLFVSASVPANVANHYQLVLCKFCCSTCNCITT